MTIWEFLLCSIGACAALVVNRYFGVDVDVLLTFYSSITIWLLIDIRDKIDGKNKENKDE